MKHFTNFLLSAILFLGIATFAQEVDDTSSITVTLIWDANTETNVAGYNLHYKPIGDNEWAVTNILGRLNTNAVFQIDPYEVYQYYLTAIGTNNLGGTNVIELESDYSQQIKYQMLYVNGNSNPTLLPLGGFVQTNENEILDPPTNGSIGDLTTSVLFIPDENFLSTGKSTFSILTPEMFGSETNATNVVNYYGIHKYPFGNPPTITEITAE